MCATIRWHITTPRELVAIVTALGGVIVRDERYDEILLDNCLCGVDIEKTLETVNVHKKAYVAGDWWVERRK